MRLKELFGKPLAWKSMPEEDVPFLDEVFVLSGSLPELIEEGRKWINGSFPDSIGIDKPTHLSGSVGHSGQEHAHIFGRKGRELGVINRDGSSSHGTKMRVPNRDADVLRQRGYAIPADNIVEWLSLSDPRIQLLQG
jgi:hypothetical protein